MFRRVSSHSNTNTCWPCDLDCDRRLLAAGASQHVNTQTLSGVTPLLMAAHGGYVEVVHLLLEHGAVVNMGVSLSTPALANASTLGEAASDGPWGGGEDGGDEAQFRPGVTPLIAAVEQGHVEVVEVLLLSGRADVHQAESDGTTAVVTAIRGGHLELVERLLRHGASPDDVFVDDEVGFSTWCFSHGICGDLYIYAFVCIIVNQIVSLAHSVCVWIGCCV